MYDIYLVTSLAQKNSEFSCVSVWLIKVSLGHVKEGSTLEDEEQQVGVLMGKYFHEISLPLRKVDGKFFYSS